ncbi:sulfotransferase domain-containing protein [Capilliphycus salinus ALCB114379]|uniref:sulfotransferase domain-containing protein n=1 Tax=Capilliphycus salinus TaxID=2768948 RepID=UPI0039A764F3
MVNEIFEKYYQQGQIQAQQRKWEEAICSYKKAIEIQPESHQAYIQLGDAFRSSGNLDWSIDCYIKAVQIDPKVGVSYVRLKRLIDHPDILPNQIERISQFGLEVLKERANNKQAQSIVINGLSSLGKVEEAIKFCKQIAYENNVRLKPNFVKNHWDESNKREPHFIIAGFMKCGTTSLYDYIAQHPNVLPASQKEIMFFNNENLYGLGLDWYRANFPPIPENSTYLTGEASTLYGFDSTVAQRLRKGFPNIKLIFILRNPVDRAISHYFFDLKSRGLSTSIDKIVSLGIKKVSQMKNVEQDINGCRGVVSAGLYVYFLKQWMNIFPKEQILVLTLEDLAKNTEDVMNRVFNFLDLPRHRILKPTKNNSGSYNSVNDEIRLQLSRFFKPYNEDLEKLLGEELCWQ